MKMRSFASIILLSTLFAGCATAPPQQRVVLNLDNFATQDNSVVVVMTEVPSPSLSLPGASCLLCMAVAAAMHGDLGDHTKALSSEGIPELGQELGALLAERGVKVSHHESTLDIGDLPRIRSDLPNTAERDFSSIASDAGATHVLVVDPRFIGIVRNFSGYVPTADPQGTFSGGLMLVDVSTHTYELYEDIMISQSAEGEWNESDAGYPALTNAYYQALEQGKDAYRRPFYLRQELDTSLDL